MTEIIQPNSSFTTQEVISISWKFVKKYFWTIVVLFLISIIPNAVDTLFNLILQSIPGATIMVTDPFTNLPTVEPVWMWAYLVSVVSIVTGVAWAWLGLGFVRANLQILQDKKPPYSIMTSTPWIRVARLIGGGILVAWAVMIGIIALILPGIWIAVRLSLFQYYIAEGYGAIDAMKASWAATRGNFWKLLGLGFIYVGIVLLGILALGVWLFVAIPMVMLAQAYVYVLLKKNTPAHIVPVMEKIV